MSIYSVFGIILQDSLFGTFAFFVLMELGDTREEKRKSKIAFLVCAGIAAVTFIVAALYTKLVKGDF